MMQLLFIQLPSFPFRQDRNTFLRTLVSNNHNLWTFLNVIDLF